MGPTAVLGGVLRAPGPDALRHVLPGIYPRPLIPVAGSPRPVFFLAIAIARSCGDAGLPPVASIRSRARSGLERQAGPGGRALHWGGAVRRTADVGVSTGRSLLGGGAPVRVNAVRPIGITPLSARPDFFAVLALRMCESHGAPSASRDGQHGGPGSGPRPGLTSSPSVPRRALPVKNKDSYSLSPTHTMSPRSQSGSGSQPSGRRPCTRQPHDRGGLFPACSSSTRSSSG